jgi:hypothetical protein
MKILLSLLISISIYSSEAGKLYNEAFKVEKISPILSISLYEKTVKSNPSKKILKICLSRLFFLYSKYSMFEEIFILNDSFPEDKSRIKKTDALIEKISKKLSVDTNTFKKIINLSVKKNEESLKDLIIEYNKSPNLYTQSYIFAIKFKLNDMNSIPILISELNDVNPVLKFYYHLRISAKETLAVPVEKFFYEISSISELTNLQKADVLYFYANYLLQKKSYRQSVRYFRMSSTYSSKEEKANTDGNTEVAKIFIINGHSTKGCNYFKKNQRIRSESDEILYLYCNKKSTLKTLRSAISNLYKKDNSEFIKKVMNY